MPERRYRQVQSRSQMMLLPPCLDEYVSEHNPVRAIDAFVDTLDLQELGFRHTGSPRRCRPAGLRSGIAAEALPGTATSTGSAVRAGSRPRRTATWK